MKANLPERGAYNYKVNRVPGVSSNGVERTSILWAPMTPRVARDLGLSHSCRDLGTDGCLDCAEEVVGESCQFLCEDCEHRQMCPCSLIGWEARAPQEERV